MRLLSHLFLLLVLCACSGPGGRQRSFENEDNDDRTPNVPGNNLPTNAATSKNQMGNPWFIENTKQVVYCILMDEENFSRPKSDVENAIKDSFLFWKNEIDKTAKAAKGLASFSYGEMEFIKEKNCSKNADIVFYIGYNTLTSSLKKGLVNPLNIISTTMQTEYNVKTLKGRGIIYIASDRGEHRFKNPGHLADYPWAHQSLLELTLVHEVAKVFGLNNVDHPIAKANFVSRLLDEDHFNNFTTYSLEGVLFPSSTVKVCGLDSKVKDWFNIASTTECLEFIRNTESNWSVNIIEGDDREFIGVIDGNSQKSDQKARVISYLNLTDDQVVYNNSERGNRNLMQGPVVQGVELRGRYKTRVGSYSQSISNDFRARS
jgi:hypothetical protein